MATGETTRRAYGASLPRADLPSPYATASTSNPSQPSVRPAPTFAKAPAGGAVDLLADGLSLPGPTKRWFNLTRSPSRRRITGCCAIETSRRCRKSTCWGRSRPGPWTPQLGGSAPTGSASGKTEVGTIAVIPLRARNRLHARTAKSAARARHPFSLPSAMLPAAEGRL